MFGCCHLISTCLSEKPYVIVFSYLLNTKFYLDTFTSFFKQTGPIVLVGLHLY